MQYVWQHDSWPHFRWLDFHFIKELGKARFTQGKLLSKLQGLNFEYSREVQAEILTEEAVKTAAIEGQELNRDSVRSSVARRLGFPFDSLPPVDRHADGLVEVLLDATTHYDKPLTAERLKGWQAALFPTGYSGMHRIRVGEWRGSEPMQVVSGPVGREKVHFEAPPGDRVEKEMKQFFAWWERSLGEVEGLLRAAVAHFYFITIHPFEDGNGRVARALTDMALAQDIQSSLRFCSLSGRYMNVRREYYAALAVSQTSDGSITTWLGRFLLFLVRALENAENLLAGIFAKATFGQKHGRTSLTDNQRKVVNRLLDAGPGGFEGGLTTRKYVSMAKVSRATAYREITDLVKKGILEPNQGKGRSISYRLAKVQEF